MLPQSLAYRGGYTRFVIFSAVAAAMFLAAMAWPIGPFVLLAVAICLWERWA